jgi:hypothetical protein
VNSLTLDLEHCYGIKRLNADLNFVECPAIAIYAPNGVMKSSLAQVFKDIAEGIESCDRVFPARVTRRAVTIPGGRPLPPENVLVLPPYEEFFGDADKTATLLVDARLRKEYEQISADVDSAREVFFGAVARTAGTKKDIAAEIVAVLGSDGSQLYDVLDHAAEVVAAYSGPDFSNVPYDLISDDRVAKLIAAKEVKASIEAYIQTYNKLLAASKYFKKGTFDYHNATTAGKALASSGFFDAKHRLTLVSETKVDVSTLKELEQVIAREKDAILKDATLRKNFDEIEKRITKNEHLRDLQAFLAENEEILTVLTDLEGLKKATILAYIQQHQQLLQELLIKYHAAESRRKEIESEAARQRTQWERVIELFNRRFFVPFQLKVTNKVSVVLGDERVPALGFTFGDGPDTAELTREELLRVLSTGERKALYILNVIFQIEVRRQAGQDTLFIVDDIADSFDYRNKYAIIQYLKDISEEPFFRQIILTHNFDFFRTVESRFVRYSHCRMVQRNDAGLELVNAVGIRNVFVTDWKPNFHNDARKRVAAVSFIRNLIEYTRGTDNDDYRTLTKLLHWRPDSETISHADLDRVYRQLFGGAACWPQPVALVVDTVRSEAELCLNAPQGINLENKVVLSIASRLSAEKHMASVINDASFFAGLTHNQTAQLLRRYKSLHGVRAENVRLLDEVALVTPENIHLNSFMYEPILDMADDHLRSLYRRVQALD